MKVDLFLNGPELSTAKADYKWCEHYMSAPDHFMGWTFNYTTMQFCSEEFSLSTGHAAAPAALTPGVAVKAEYSAVTDLFLGSKVAFTLTVGFPAGVTSGVIVEILPSTNVTIMAVGSVNMTRGANLDIDPNTKLVYHPSEESKDVSCFFCSSSRIL